jgi:hypothetical protein
MLWEFKVWKFENWEKRLLQKQKMAIQWRDGLRKKACFH